MKNIDLFKILQNNYNIQIIGIEKNSESSTGNVYLINTVDSKYIVKVYSNYEHTQSMINLYDLLNKNDFYVPKIIQTKNKEYYKKYNDTYVVMYSFLEGIQLKYIINTIEKDELSRLAKEIRRLHDLTQNTIYNLKPINFKVNYEFKRKSILHFDLTKDNIFINQNKVGFIDFDDAKYGPSIYDVTIAISLLFFSKSRGAELDKIKTFIDSYYENDSINKEKEVPYIKSITLKWIDYLLNENSFDTSTKESFEVKRKLINKYL